jgi:hypothetical protein
LIAPSPLVELELRCARNGAGGTAFLTWRVPLAPKDWGGSIESRAAPGKMHGVPPTFLGERQHSSRSGLRQVAATTHAICRVAQTATPPEQQRRPPKEPPNARSPLIKQLGPDKPLLLLLSRVRPHAAPKQRPTSERQQPAGDFPKQPPQGQRPTHKTTQSRQAAAAVALRVRRHQHPAGRTARLDAATWLGSPPPCSPFVRETQRARCVIGRGPLLLLLSGNGKRP